jgi:hypothetical protein
MQSNKTIRIQVTEINNVACKAYSLSTMKTLMDPSPVTFYDTKCKKSNLPSLYLHTHSELRFLLSVCKHSYCTSYGKRFTFPLIIMLSISIIFSFVTDKHNSLTQPEHKVPQGALLRSARTLEQGNCTQHMYKVVFTFLCHSVLTVYLTYGQYSTWTVGIEPEPTPINVTAPLCSNRFSYYREA